MADFIGGGLPTVPPSAASHSDPNASNESPAPVTTLDPPTSNPGADDPSGGIAKDAGGASGSAYVGSPVTQEHESNKTVVGAVLETVFGKKEKTADEFDSTTNTSNKENSATMASSSTTTDNNTTGAPGVLGAVAGAAAAGTAAVASYVGLSNTDTTPKEEGDKTAASVEKSAAETEAAGGEKANEAVAATKEATTADTDEGEGKADAIDEAKDTSHVGSHVGNDPKTVSDHEAATRENKDAIPLAGGEKLGTAHEGESKMIPDLPPQDPSADETKVGQPDQTTADNTAKNTGGATAPAATDSTTSSGHKHDESSPSGKGKFMDRVKAKLHLDKKVKS